MNYALPPIYAQIADQLRHHLQEGVYKVGDKLPSQAQLSAQYGVNRHTLRQAIALLKNEGLLRVDKGLGMFVAEAPIQYPIGKRVRFNEALQAQSQKGNYQLLQATEMTADAKLALKLEIKSGDSIALVQLLGLAENQPFFVSVSYFPLKRFPDMVQQWQQGTQSISKLMRDTYGCDHIRRCTYISARLVRPQDARLLKLSLNQPILLVESINVDENDCVIEYGVTRFRGDRMELVLDIES